MKKLSALSPLTLVAMLLALGGAPWAWAQYPSSATGTYTVSQVGQRVIYTFTGSGSFTLARGLTADILVVGGGGGGGGAVGYSGGTARANCGGGGGAGGLVAQNSVSLTAQQYAVTVGAGGAAGTSAGKGANGGNSVFGTYTAAGGGGGGSGYYDTSVAAGIPGGSGGGGGRDGGGVNGAAGSGTSGQGNNGDAAVQYRGGGGGGAGAAGSAQNGGNGTASSITGTSVTYAGGGGAGTYSTNNFSTSAGGTGGGGAGFVAGWGNAGTGTAGTTNTGGGGGGGASAATADSATGGAGGSGIVVVSYSIPHPTAVVSGSATICGGSSTTILAGLTGTGPWNVNWSDGVNQSNVSASPATRNVSPSTTTTYTVTNLTDAFYATALADDLTGSAVVTVNAMSANPTSASASVNPLCTGGSTVLTLTGGGGGTGETITWYTGSCGGTLAGTGNSLSVSPTTTTTYYGRYEDGAPCSYNSACVQVTVTVTFNGVSLSGTVFDDANGLTDSMVNGNGTNVNGLLYANLVDASGTVLASVAVASDGTYSFDSISNGSYTVQVTVNAGTVGQPMPATALPANWANTGEHLGTESGSDGTPDGLLAVTVETVNLDKANFGIDALPDSPAASGSCMNPGGTVAVTVPALTGSDLEDGALGSGSTVVIETLPGNATLAYNRSPVMPGQTITDYNPALLTVDPNFEGIGTVTFTFAFKDAAGQVDPSPATATLTFDGVSLSGTVFDHANGLTDSTVNGNGTNVNGLLYANLVDAIGKVLASVAVSGDGTYSFTNISSGSYTVQVSVNAGTAGQPMPATALPANWVNTGEHLGAGTGSDGTPDGLLAVTVAAADVANANFGIDALPDSTPTGESYLNPGGTATVTVPTLTGSDLEDGALGSGNTVVISTLPDNATLYYNGVAVTAGQVITSYTPALLKLDPNFEGSGTVTFTFAFKDTAGQADPTTATATLTFNGVSLSGTVFDDANGLTDSTVNGNGTNVNGLLYANLVDASGKVLASVAVSGDGTYRFTNISSGSYTVQVSVNAGTVGQPMPATALPANWANTGEHLGAGTGSDGTPDGLLAVTVDTVNLDNANFGIQQTFSLGNRVFADNGVGGGTANNGVQDGTEPGIAGVVMKLYAADGSGNPTNSVLGTTNTDADGYYRFDGLVAATYVVVVDVVASAGALSGLESSTGYTTNLTTTEGDLHDHGQDTPLGSESVLPGGIASVPVQVGIGPQPTGEATSGSGAGANGPRGDESDNLVVDFGFYKPPPAAEVAWLGAYVDQDQVWVTWQTLSELGLLRFEVWRSAQPGAEELVTPDPIFADGGAIGHAYQVPDLTAVLPGQYTYRLVGWYDNGSTQELAKVTVALAKGATADVVRIIDLEMQTDGVRVRWLGGQPPYVLESSPSSGPDAAWRVVGPAQPGETEALVPAEGGSGFFRVRGSAGEP